MKKIIALTILCFGILSCGSDSSDMPITDDVVQDDSSDDVTPPGGDNPDPNPIDPTSLGLVKSATFGTVDADVADRLVIEPNGSLIHLGRSNQRTNIFAINSDFDVLWTEFYDGLNLLDMRLTPDNQLIVSGGTDTANSDDSDAILAKLDLSGAVIWQTTVAGELGENLQSVDFTSDGGYVAAGNTTSTSGFINQNNGGQDLIVVKFDSNGDMEWANNYGGTDSDRAEDILVLPNGNFLVMGTTISTDGDVTDNDGIVDIWMLLLEPDGTLISSKTIGSLGSDGGNSIHVLQNGNYLIAGRNEEANLDATENNGNQDAWVVIIDTNLNIVDQASFGDSELELSRDFFELPNGDFIITGISWSSEGIAIDNKGASDYMVLRMSPDLMLKDTLLIGGRNLDFVSGAVLADKNTLWLTGSTTSSDGDIMENNGGFDVWTTQIFVPDN